MAFESSQLQTGPGYSSEQPNFGMNGASQHYYPVINSLICFAFFETVLFILLIYFFFFSLLRNHHCITLQALLMVHMLKITSLILVLHSRDMLPLPLISLLLLPPISLLLLPPISRLHSKMSNNLTYFFPHQFLMFPRYLHHLVHIL